MIFKIPTKSNINEAISELENKNANITSAHSGVLAGLFGGISGKSVKSYEGQRP